jgi:hypothetical protein
MPPDLSGLAIQGAFRRHSGGYLVMPISQKFELDEWGLEGYVETHGACWQIVKVSFRRLLPTPAGKLIQETWQALVEVQNLCSHVCILNETLYLSQFLYEISRPWSLSVAAAAALSGRLVIIRWTWSTRHLRTMSRTILLRTEI